MADEQAKIAQEQLPIYDKATEATKDTGDDKQSGTGEGTASCAKISSPQPPASNPSAEDATGGIPEGAGGLSSTAHIESPVPNNDQSLFSTVKSMLGFGATEEIKAEDKGPAEDATTAPKESLLAGSAIAAPVAAVTGIFTSDSSATAGPTTTTSTSTSSDLPSTGTTTGTGQGTYLDYQQAAPTDSSTAFPSSQTLPIRSTPGGSLPSDNTSAAKTDTTLKSTESTDKTATSTTNESTMADSEHKPPVPADGKPTGGKGLENVDAIPTAGGKKLGEDHLGESDIVPDDPKAAADKQANVSSKDGQPTEQVKDNTSKNTGGATSGPHGHGEQSGQGKEKFVDKIKDKLHIGSKK